jgi:hypothetical protein
MPESSTRVRDLPHFRIHAADLAKWVESQGDESWWSVDGDPILTQRLDFPCTGDELAGVLRKLGKPLLLLDVKEPPTATGEAITFHDLDRVAYRHHSGDRIFQLCWEDGPDVDWLLVEDTETSESILGDDEER